MNITKTKNKFTKIIEFIIFRVSKQLLVPFYFYLLYTLIKVAVEFYLHGHLGNEHLMETLEAVDVVMIANLIVMIITGSYNSFVSKEHDYDGEKIGSGMLKVKMASSIMGVSSIHLLSAFIDSTNTSWDDIFKQCLIHAMFIIGCIALSYVDFLHSKSETFHEQKH